LRTLEGEKSKRGVKNRLQGERKGESHEDAKRFKGGGKKPRTNRVARKGTSKSMTRGGGKDKGHQSVLGVGPTPREP